MNFHRQWRGWRFLERGLLWSVLGFCTFVAAQPLRERFVAWQNQRSLDAKWQQAVNTSHQHSAHKTSASKVPSQKHPASKVQPKKHPPAKISMKSPPAPPAEPILWPLVRLSCSPIGLDAVVVQGTGAAQLKEGPGHEPDTSFPGGPNCVIAAHRNAYGWWFYHLNSLKMGDAVVLQTPERKFIYRVAASRKVSVRDTSILRSPAKAAPRLTLYTCTLPKTESRLVVIANLETSGAT